MDNLIFTSDSVRAKKVEEPLTANRDLFATPQFDVQGISEDLNNKETEVDVEVQNVERPVDLYKVQLFCNIPRWY